MHYGYWKALLDIFKNPVVVDCDSEFILSGVYQFKQLFQVPNFPVCAQSKRRNFFYLSGDSVRLTLFIFEVEFLCRYAFQWLDLLEVKRMVAKYISQIK